MKNIKNKKGDMSTIMIAVLIITLVLLIALLYPQYNIFAKIGGKMPYEICRNSVETASLMRFKNIELSPFLKCETQQYTITKNNAEEAKKTIADAMYNCYYQFAQGEKQLFSDEGKFCFICSTIDYELGGTKITELPEFQKYLFENYADSKNTYAQYLYKDKSDQTKKDLGTKYVTALLRQKLGVFFTYDRFRTSANKELTQYLNKIALAGSTTAFVSAYIPLVGTPLAVISLAGSGLALVGGYAVQMFGDYSQISTVQLIQYSPEEINKLGCTQKIPQKNK